MIFLSFILFKKRKKGRERKKGAVRQGKELVMTSRVHCTVHPRVLLIFLLALSSSSMRLYGTWASIVDDYIFFLSFFLFFIIHAELGLTDGSQLIVADVTTPASIEFHLKLVGSMDT